MEDYAKEITILYVEDEDDVREGYSRTLLRICKHLYTASNGEEGLELFVKHKPDIVVSDIRMPKMNGIEMAQEIKKRDIKNNIIFTSAHSEGSYLFDAIELQVEGYLLKPVQKNKMVELIKKLAKNIILEKKNEEQKQILQHIMDAKNTLSAVINKESISFASKSFLNLFGVKSVEEFNQKFTTPFDIFLNTEGALSKDKIEKELSKEVCLYQYVESLEKTDRIITLKDNDITKLFYINISKINQECCLVNLTDITEIEEEKKKIEKKVYIDGLTGVYNRNKFEEIFEYEAKKSRRYKRPFCVAILDIDHFKDFNDRYGHLIGDEILIMLANVMKNSIRESDLFARWGGEEFVILFNDTTLENAMALSNKFKNIIENLQHKTAGGITVSFGLTQFREDDTMKSFFQRADMALYEAKSSGRNCVKSLI